MQGLDITKSVAIKKNNDFYLSRLERLIFIEKGEIPGMMGEGSNVSNFFWDPAISNTVRGIILELKRLVYRYESNMSIKAITAGITPLTSGEMMIIIELEFYTKNNPVDLKTLTLTKIRGE